MNNHEEIWKSISLYEGQYEVSNKGRIRSLMTNHGVSYIKILALYKEKKGYPTVKLHKKDIGKTFRIHNLVLQSFVGPRPKGYCCRHLDGNKENNNLNNLKWGTYRENWEDKVLHGTNTKPKGKLGSSSYNAKLNEKIVKIIKYLLKYDCFKRKEIAQIFDISTSVIQHIAKNRSWKHVI